jgi:hypothetical protein
MPGSARYDSLYKPRNSAVQAANPSAMRNVITACENRVLDARMIGWVALEQSWSADLVVVLSIAKQRGIIE